MAAAYMSGREKRCLRKLFLTDPADDKKALKRKKGDRAPGTCSWILESGEVQMWIRNQDSELTGDPNVLWLYGDPGTGKSTTAITIAEELPTHPSFRGKHLAYFFCDSSFSTRRTATAILRGLIYQLIEQDTRLVKILFSKYYEHKDNLFSSFDALWSVLIGIGANRETGEKYCIVDALDESERDSQEQLLKQINLDFLGSNPARSCPGIRFLITSRPYAEIGRQLHGFSCKYLGSYNNVQEDLNTFIKTKVDHLKDKNRYTESVARDVSERLQAKAEGTFLWVEIASQELEGVRPRSAANVIEKLPRGLDAMYQGLLDDTLRDDDQDQAIIMRILSMVAVAYMPLTVSQLAGACDLYQTKEEEDRLAFTREDIEQCRLMVILEDNLVQLLHKSVKDFVLGDGENHPISILKAHASLAYRCLSCVLETIQVLDSLKSEGRPPKQFVKYANGYWPQHAASAQNEFKVLPIHSKILEVTTQEWMDWALVSARDTSLGREGIKGYLHVPFEEFSVYHFAAIWGIPALADFAFQKDGPNSYDDQIYELEGRGTGREEWRTPLEECAFCGNVDIMAILLDHKQSNMLIKEKVLVVAARNEEVGGLLFSLLMDQPKSQTQLTPKVLGYAASNLFQGREILDTILDRRRDQVSITSEVVGMIENSPSGNETIAFLLDPMYNVQVTEEAIVFICRRGDRNLAGTLLLREQGDARFTQEAALAILESFDVDTVQLLINRPDPPIIIAEDGVRATLRNHEHGKELVPLLFRTWEIKMSDLKHVIEDCLGDPTADTQAIFSLMRHGDFQPTLGIVLTACANRSSNMVEYLFSIHMSPIEVKEDMLVAAASNWRYGTEVMAFLLERCPDQIDLIEDIVIEAERNPWNGEAIIALLLSQGSDRIRVSQVAEEMIVESFGLENVKWLVYQQWTKTGITLESLMNLVLKRDGHEITQLIQGIRQQDNMLNKGFLGSHIQITEQVVQSLLVNTASGSEVLEFLLVHQRVRVQFTPAAVILICKSFGSNLVRLMFEKMDTDVSIPRQVMIIAFERFPLGLVRLLLEKQRGGNLVFSKDIATAVVSNTACRDKVMGLIVAQGKYRLRIMSAEMAMICRVFDAPIIHAILREQEAGIDLTGEMVQAAAENPRSGEAIMRMVFDEYGNRLKITDGGKHACCRWFNASIVQLMLDKCSSCVEITAEMMRAAAQNWKDGYNVLSLLLERIGSSFLITDDIMKVALGNWFQAKALVGLLLDQPTDNLQITEASLTRTAASWQNGSKVMAKLLDKPGATLRVTEEVVVTAAAGITPDVLALLLARQELKIHISEKVLRAAVANEYSGKHVLQLILGKGRQDLQVTESVLKAAAKNLTDGSAIMALLLNRLRSKIVITRGVLCAAASNRHHANAIAGLLFTQRQSHVTIKDDAIRIAPKIPGWKGLGPLVDGYVEWSRRPKEYFKDRQTLYAVGHETIAQKSSRLFGPARLIIPRSMVWQAASEDGFEGVD